ncbi:MAG TPA: STAS domain-containing protein [Gaiellaceae bacterium]|nr:STAS domain-containing protein [Gaiellaceae bacterium]
MILVRQPAADRQAAAVAVVPHVPRGSAAGLAGRIEVALALGRRHVVVDLGDLADPGVPLLAQLRRAAVRVRAQGGQLSVVCRHPAARRLLRLTLLSESLAVARTREEALRGCA